MEYVTTYTPSLLASISRSQQRIALGITDPLPFVGMDVWNAYEFTWLNNMGKPQVALAQFQVPVKSANVIESKSLKMYLGSFSDTRFGYRAEVISTLEGDLTLCAGAPVSVTLISPDQVQQSGLSPFAGQSLDLVDVEVDEYYWNPGFLSVETDTIVRESLFTHLFKSICPISGQPDFASIFIQYKGRNISQEGLLKYLISYRQHAEYVEQIIERIFVDLLNRCEPDRLSVHGRFTRRGGIDINPIRSIDADQVAEIRLWRQ